MLLSGGGTAGHIYPALTVAERLSGAGHDVAFVGTPTGLEARLVPAAGVAFHALAARGFDRARPWTLFTGAVVIAASTVRAWLLLGRFRPDVVMGFGGYVSLPVGFAALTRRIPLVLHEQNSVPGMANAFLSRWARSVGVTYEASRARLAHPDRTVVTGNPVRGSVLVASREEGRRKLGLPVTDTVMLVFGGSQGARHVNTATLDLYARLSEVADLRVLHVTGPREFERARERLSSAEEGAVGRVREWRLLDYLADMPDALAAADLVVARAGATSIAEITAIGRAAVLVPYPYATDDHQTLNGRTVADAGACIMVADADLDTPAFGDAVLGLLGEGEARERMARASAALGRRDAAERVAELALSAAGTASHSRRDGS